MRLYLFMILTVATSVVMGQDVTDGGAKAPVKTLAQLADQADFIGLVQVRGVDYEAVRSLPSKGFALLDVRLVYRHPGEAWEKPSQIQVFEQGFADNACYYPQRWNEGRRFLAFLQKRKENGYQGKKPWCMLPLLVTEDFRYALRYPIVGVELTDTSVVRELEFADPDAFVNPGEDLTRSRARTLQKKGYLQRTEDHRYHFTHGILISDVRQLMFGDG